LQSLHNSPRTSPVLWSWSTHNISRSPFMMFSLPQTAHFPF
jgi:hypothetical protein